ncbi:MAG: hypothetical protein ABGX83_07935 [Nitrospira sp.]|nr:hypothetical protein [Candidatus Manganitrophaceae bacterium]HIL34124.1 hypothetical protein [Candidatus Manganitrophaceae bacterium]
MLHRMKLRVVYGGDIAKDKVARRLKLKIILQAGFAVLIPFMGITYFLLTDPGVMELVLIGFLSSLSCVPVVLYAYAKGYGRPLADLWRERPNEMKYLAIKIGFLYGFALYWMILGIVEFLFGYDTFRAALISFVASAAARDGFEIGYYRAKAVAQDQISIFPDNRSIAELFPVAPAKIFALLSTVIIGGGVTGAFLGPLLPNTLHQAVAIGTIVGIVATFAYTWSLEEPPGFPVLIRFFIWPGFTMALTYFLIWAYLLRKVFLVNLSPSIDFGLLMAACSGWMTFETLFLGYLQWKKPVDSSTVPEEHADPVAS